MEGGAAEQEFAHNVHQVALDELGHFAHELQEKFESALQSSHVEVLLSVLTEAR